MSHIKIPNTICHIPAYVSEVFIIYTFHNHKIHKHNHFSLLILTYLWTPPKHALYFYFFFTIFCILLLKCLFDSAYRLQILLNVSIKYDKLNITKCVNKKYVSQTKFLDISILTFKMRDLNPKKDILNKNKN